MSHNRYFTFWCDGASSMALDNKLNASILCTLEEIADGLLKQNANTGLPDHDQIDAVVLAATRVLAMACTNRDNEALQNAAHELRRVSGIAVSGTVAA